MVFVRAWLPVTAEKFLRLAELRADPVLHHNSLTGLYRTSESFGKRNRLLSKEEFQRVFKDAEKSGDHFIVVFGRMNGLNNARLGLAISRNCSKRSVDRNLIKRLSREVFRKSKRDLSGIDFVVICRPGAVALSNRLLTKSLSKHFKRVRLRLCGSS